MDKVTMFFTEHEALGVCFACLGIIALIVAFAKTMQTMGLEKVRGVVYKAFIHAEHSFLHGDNEHKFEYVVETAQNAIPFPFNMFITEALLRDVIQAWFDVCKDLLDDGKLNNSESEVKE